MMYGHRPATAEDIRTVIPKIRDIDRLEAEVVSGKSLEEVLDGPMKLDGDCKVILVNGEVEGVFGCAFGKDFGVPWMLASDKAFEDTRYFLKESKRLVNSWQSNNKALLNYVHKDNHKAIRWLKYLGFTFMAPRDFGGETFIEFVRIYV